MAAGILIIIVTLLVGVLVTAARKRRARGTTWFPEGFSLRPGSTSGTGEGAKPKNRRRPEGQEMK